ncbi:unnamed protein product [Rotaria sp. Silwood2]|nr:unnamed protein product [Rotaria sp. Silwood2]CAF3899749.1 unnamed protein product [Rotaria sp. Silwood2]
MNFDYDDSLDDTPLLTTTRVPEPTQKEMNQYKKSNISEGTDSCISFDFNQDKPNTHSSLHTLSPKIKSSLTHLIPINHSQDVTVTASSLTSSIDITAAVSEPTSSAINTNSITTTSNKKQNRMDLLLDLTVQLNEVTEDRDKWKDKYLALEKRYSELSDVSMYSTDDEESLDEIETDVVGEGDGNDNEQNTKCIIYHIRKLINTKSTSTPCTLSSIGTSSMIICQKYERVSFSKTSCSHIDCEDHEKYATNPYNYIYFDIRDQLQQIFRREQHISCFTPENKPFINTSMHDIYDGKIYRSLFSQVETNQTNYIKTLVMNVDGVAVGNNTEQSLWIITCAINEIKRKQRFKIQNVVVGGICSCYKKPSRAIMQILLVPIVNQLLLLEEQHLFQIKGTENEYKLIRMYLIGACNDKPANSLVQNAPEPIAKYDCSRCELRGIYVINIC